MEENFKCPRCGFEQAPKDDCRKCGVSIPKYIELQKRRRAVPDGESQRTVRKPASEEKEKSGPPESDPNAQKEEISPAPPGSPSTGEIIVKQGLPELGTCFERSWEIFKRRIGTLISLYLLSAIFFVVPMGIFIGIGYLISLLFSEGKPALMVSGGIVGMIAGIIAASWGYAGFIFAIADENLGIGDCLAKGWQRVGAFIWLLSILGYIVMGGFLLFFIPGVMFAVWFPFSQFIIAREDERGMNALLKSKEYVRRYFWDVFLRLIVIWAASAGVGMVPIIGPILSILFTPFMMIFIYVIYEDMRSIKGDIAYSSSAGEKLKWIGVGALGYVVVPLIIIALMGASLMASLFLLKEMLNR